MKKNTSNLQPIQIFAIIVMLAAVGIMEWFIVSGLANNHMAKRTQELIQKIESEDAKKYNEDIQLEKETIGKTEFVVAYPLNDRQEVIKEYQKILDEELAVAKDKYAHESKKTKVFLKVYQTKVLTGIDDTYYYRSVYQDTDKGWDQIEYQELRHQLVSEKTGETVSIENLFVTDLLATNFFVKKAITIAKNEGLTVEQTNQLLSAFADENWKNLDTSILQNGIRFTLGQPITTEKGKTILEVTIAFQDMFAILNKESIPTNELEAYQSYQNQIHDRLQQKRVAITFDDGPNAKTTPQALDILQQYGVHATFFMMGKHVPGNENLVKRMVDEGHELGNHSYTHPLLTELSANEVYNQIHDTQNAIAHASGGIKPTIMRPPYGGYDAMVAENAKIALVNWSVDTLDWQTHNPESILQEVKEGVYSGAIILMHDIHQDTIDTLPQLLDYLQQEGYEIGSVEELMANQPMLSGYMYFDRKLMQPA